MNNNAGLLNYYTKLLLPLNCLSSLAADKQYYYLCDHSDTTCMCVIQKQWLLLNLGVQELIQQSSLVLCVWMSV